MLYLVLDYGRIRCFVTANGSTDSIIHWNVCGLAKFSSTDQRGWMGLKVGGISRDKESSADLSTSWQESVIHKCVPEGLVEVNLFPDTTTWDTQDMWWLLPLFHLAKDQSWGSQNTCMWPHHGKKKTPWIQRTCRRALKTPWKGHVPVLSCRFTQRWFHVWERAEYTQNESKHYSEKHIIYIFWNILSETNFFLYTDIFFCLFVFHKGSYDTL